SALPRTAQARVYDPNDSFWNEQTDYQIILTFDDIPAKDAKAIVSNKLGWLMWEGTVSKDAKGQDVWATSSDGTSSRRIVAYAPAALTADAACEIALEIDGVSLAESRSQSSGRYDSYTMRDISLYFDDMALEDAKRIVTDNLGWEIVRVMDYLNGEWGQPSCSGEGISRQIIVRIPSNLNVDVACENAETIDGILSARIPDYIASANWMSYPLRLCHVAGYEALDTMVTIADYGWRTGSCDAAVVVSVDSASDGMTATGLAGLLGCPVIATDGSSLSSQAEAEIRRLGVSTVYLIGGTSVLDDAVQQAVAALPKVKTVERVWGVTAADTSAAVAQKGYELGEWGSAALIAMTGDYRDSMSAAPYAYADHAPVLLSDEDGLSDEVAALAAEFSDVVIAGGPNAVPESVESQVGSASVTRVYGQTAYDTSAAFADWCLERGMALAGAGTATGTNHMDALAGAALCGKNNAPLILVSDPSASEAIAYFDAHSDGYTLGYTFGGTSVISADAVWALHGIASRNN
ncbi:MAG: cell wall-binding repeat-containing protein, partial [Eggerthellales bacterium]|nr:cell wall-binding repeat-containing protein [Eggerthellales bacterium]